jgi:hypothetical protein
VFLLRLCDQRSPINSKTQTIEKENAQTNIIQITKTENREVRKNNWMHGSPYGNEWYGLNYVSITDNLCPIPFANILSK